MNKAFSPDPSTGATPHAQTLDFHFDFLSPYGYFASCGIEALAQRQGCALRWRPFHMRAVTRDVVGMDRPLADLPLKGPYVRHDVQRMARYLGLPYSPAPASAFTSVTASRVFYLIDAHDRAAAVRYAHAVFQSQHVRAQSPNSWDACVALAVEAGADPSTLIESEQAERARALFQQATTAAIAQGVWGTPTFGVGSELFWGCDRMGQVEDWLARGGW